MPVKVDCQEYHLTPHGWVIGSFKVDAASRGGVDVPTPRNRVLTIGYFEKYVSELSNPTHSRQVLWESEDRQAVQKCKKSFGARPPRSVGKANRDPTTRIAC